MSFTVTRRLVLAGLLGAVAAAAPAIGAAEAAWSPLVDPQALDAAAADGALVVDIRAPEAYGAGHVPGAVSAPYPLWRGPRANPGQPLSDAALTALLQTIGAERDRPTIVTHQGASDTGFGAAARVYWTLKASGLTRIAILNGGVAAYAASGRALSQEPVVPEPSDIVASLDPALTADRSEVAAISEGRSVGALVDARPAAFFAGETQHPAAAAAGTISGAERLSHNQWFQSDGVSIADDAGAVQRILAQTGAAAQAAASGDEIAVFCNTGHWAATTWFALSEIAGLDNVKLYPGSVVDWTTAGGPVSPNGL